MLSKEDGKKKEEVVTTYSIIDASTKEEEWNNDGYKIERRLLGDDKVNLILHKVEELASIKSESVISGNEVMELLGIEQGPVVGKILQYVSKHGLTREDVMDQLTSIHNEVLK